MIKTTSIEHQNMMDIAIQECGGVASVFDFALLNGFSVTEQLEIGVKLEVPTVKAAPEIALFFKKHSIRIATDAQWNRNQDYLTAYLAMNLTD